MKNISIIIKQRIKINTLENELETLKKYIKNNLFNECINYIDEKNNNKILKEENKKLRIKIKELKNKNKGD